jgi:hypothetical protein
VKTVDAGDSRGSLPTMFGDFMSALVGDSDSGSGRSSEDEEVSVMQRGIRCNRNEAVVPIASFDKRANI